jgi:hypothetical protein
LHGSRVGHDIYDAADAQRFSRVWPSGAAVSSRCSVPDIVPKRSFVSLLVPGPDVMRGGSTQLLSVAKEVVIMQASKGVREDRGLSYFARVSSLNSFIFPGWGYYSVMSLTGDFRGTSGDPLNTAALLGASRTALQTPPSQEQFNRSLTIVSSQHRSQFTELTPWLPKLRGMSLRPPFVFRSNSTSVRSISAADLVGGLAQVDYNTLVTFCSTYGHLQAAARNTVVDSAIETIERGGAAIQGGSRCSVP